MLALYTPPITAAGDEVARALAEAGASGSVTVAAVFIDWQAALDATEGRLPAYPSPEAAADALGLAADYGDWRRRDTCGNARAHGAGGAHGAYCRATWQRAQDTWSGSTAR